MEPPTTGFGTGFVEVKPQSSRREHKLSLASVDVVFGHGQSIGDSEF